MFKSKLNKTSLEANKVKVQVGSYTYDYDLLTLKVYDESDVEYSIGQLLSLIIDNQEKIKSDELSFSEEIKSIRDIISSQALEINQLKTDKAQLESKVKALEDVQAENDKIIIE